jgi:hypothetical protein
MPSLIYSIVVILLSLVTSTVHSEDFFLAHKDELKSVEITLPGSFIREYDPPFVFPPTSMYFRKKAVSWSKETPQFSLYPRIILAYLSNGAQECEAVDDRCLDSLSKFISTTYKKAKIVSNPTIVLRPSLDKVIEIHLEESVLNQKLFYAQFYHIQSRRFHVAQLIGLASEKKEYEETLTSMRNSFSARATTEEQQNQISPNPLHSMVPRQEALLSDNAIFGIVVIALALLIISGLIAYKNRISLIMWYRHVTRQ